MTDQTTPPVSPAQPGQASSTLWTVFLGAALVGLVAWPGRRAGSLPGASGPAKGDRKLGAEDGPASHERAEAERLAEPEAVCGRKADTRSEIPEKGWKDIAFRLYQEFSNVRILLVAAGVTFYAILALFPPSRRSSPSTARSPTRARSTST